MRLMKIDVAAAAVCVAIVALVPTVGLAPARQSREVAAQLVDEAVQLRVQFGQNVQTNDVLRRSIERETAALAAIGEQAIVRKPLNQRIAMINTVAEDAGLEVTRLSPRRDAADGTVRGIDLAAMGRFAGVIALLESLERPDLSLWAESFEVRSRQDRPGWVTLTTELAWHADSAGD